MGHTRPCESPCISVRVLFSFMTFHPLPFRPSHTPADWPECFLEAHCGGCGRVTLAASCGARGAAAEPARSTCAPVAPGPSKAARKRIGQSSWCLQPKPSCAAALVALPRWLAPIGHVEVVGSLPNSRRYRPRDRR
jgi:hypothetical protein